MKRMLMNFFFLIVGLFSIGHVSIAMEKNISPHRLQEGHNPNDTHGDEWEVVGLCYCGASLDRGETFYTRADVVQRWMRSFMPSSPVVDNQAQGEALVELLCPMGEGRYRGHWVHALCLAKQIRENHLACSVCKTSFIPELYGLAPKTGLPHEFVVGETMSKPQFQAYLSGSIRMGKYDLAEVFVHVVAQSKDIKLEPVLFNDLSLHANAILQQLFVPTKRNTEVVVREQPKAYTGLPTESSSSRNPPHFTEMDDFCCIQ